MQRILVALLLSSLVVLAAAQSNDTQPTREVVRPGQRQGCPTCQRKVGRPVVGTDRKDKELIMLNAGDFSMIVSTKDARVKFTLFSSADPGRSKYTLQLHEMFQVNNTADILNRVNISARVKFDDKDKKNLAYTWEVSQPQDVHDSTTAMVKFLVTAIPAGTSAANDTRPSLQFTQKFISSENKTTSKFDVKIDNFEERWWQRSQLVLAFRAFTVSKDGFEMPPKRWGKVAPGNARQVPRTPATGAATGGEERVVGAAVDIDGVTLVAAPTATSANGNNVTVSLFAGPGCCDEEDAAQQMVYLVFDRFRTAVTYDPYFELNDASLDSPAAALAPSAAVATSAVLLVVSLLLAVVF